MAKKCETDLSKLIRLVYVSKQSHCFQRSKCRHWAEAVDLRESGWIDWLGSVGENKMIYRWKRLGSSLNKTLCEFSQKSGLQCNRFSCLYWPVQLLTNESHEVSKPQYIAPHQIMAGWIFSNHERTSRNTFVNHAGNSDRWYVGSDLKSVALHAKNEPGRIYAPKKTKTIEVSLFHWSMGCAWVGSVSSKFGIRFQTIYMHMYLMNGKREIAQKTIWGIQPIACRIGCSQPFSSTWAGSINLNECSHLAFGRRPPNSPFVGCSIHVVNFVRGHVWFFSVLQQYLECSRAIAHYCLLNIVCLSFPELPKAAFTSFYSPNLAADIDNLEEESTPHGLRQLDWPYWRLAGMP